MKWYVFIKLIHIVSSTFLFGTGIGTASVMLYAHSTKDTYFISRITQYVVLADWIFTAPSALVQPITGLLMVWLAGYSLSSLWIWGSIAGYCIAGACWVPVVFLQYKMRNLAMQAHKNNKKLPLQYYQLFKIWFCLGWPAFISLVIVFYLMTFKPF